MKSRGRGRGADGKDFFGERNLKLQKRFAPSEERTQQHRVFKCLCKKQYRPLDSSNDSCFRKHTKTGRKGKVKSLA